MDADYPRHHEIRGVESRTVDWSQCDRGKEGAMNRESLPLLAAYGDDILSIEAANQIIQMAEDTSRAAYTGEDIPLADKAALLRRAASLQKSR